MRWRKFWERLGYKEKYPVNVRLPLPQYNPERWQAGMPIEAIWPGCYWQKIRVDFKRLDVIRLIFSRRISVTVYARTDVLFNEMCSFVEWNVEPPVGEYPPALTPEKERE